MYKAYIQPTLHNGHAPLRQSADTEHVQQSVSCTTTRQKTTKLSIQTSSDTNFLCARRWCSPPGADVGGGVNEVQSRHMPPLPTHRWPLDVNDNIDNCTSVTRSMHSTSHDLPMNRPNSLSVHAYENVQLPERTQPLVVKSALAPIRKWWTESTVCTVVHVRRAHTVCRRATPTTCVAAQRSAGANSVVARSPALHYRQTRRSTVIIHCRGVHTPKAATLHR